jgi:hypothetical protein
MSWDNNNLACILVFPPWQRKGLGALLIGASYEISRRERILGGPEKPISDLGKRGYRRFWAAEVARWILSLELKAGKGEQGEVIVDINDISDATWIAPEDCLGVLKDMGVAEEADMGPGKPLPRTDLPPANTTLGRETADEEMQPGPVKVDKEAVRRWLVQHRISLEKTCDPAGFVEGYAISKEDVEGEDEDEDEDEEMVE